MLTEIVGNPHNYDPQLRGGYRKTVYYQGLGSTSALPLPCMVEEATIPQSRDMVVY